MFSSLKSLAERVGLDLREQDLEAILLYAQVDYSDPTREAKLRKIQKEIESGQYRIRADHVADALLAESEEATLVRLVEALSRIPVGPEGWHEFENGSALLTASLLSGELCNFGLQREIGHRSRVDLLAYNSAQSGFFDQLRTVHQIGQIIVEFKNRTSLEAKDLDQVLRYSGPHRAVITVSRSEPSKSLFSEFAQMLQFQKLVVPISFQDLRDALSFKLNGQQASQALIPRYSQLLAALG